LNMNLILKVFSGEQTSAGRAHRPRLRRPLGESLSNSRWRNQVQIEEDVAAGHIFPSSDLPPGNDNLMNCGHARRLQAGQRGADRPPSSPYYGYALPGPQGRGRVPSQPSSSPPQSRRPAPNASSPRPPTPPDPGCFNIPVDHLYASPVISALVRRYEYPLDDFVVLSPGRGGTRGPHVRKKLGGCPRHRGQTAGQAQSRPAGKPDRGWSMVGKVAHIR